MAVDNLLHQKRDNKFISVHTRLSIRAKKLFFAKPAGIAITLLALFGLSACGGGGSSSGSDDSNEFAGTFEGGGQADFTIGEKTINDYTPTKIIIRPQSKVEISDGSPNISTKGRLKSDEFETNGKFAFNNQGVSCDISIFYTGVITVDNGIATAIGNVTGNGQCNGEPASVDGVYTVSKISDITKSPLNSGFEENFLSVY